MLMAEDDEATPRNFYSKLMHNGKYSNLLDAGEKSLTPHHAREEFKHVDEELRMKVMHDVQEKIHENNAHDDDLKKSETKTDRDGFIKVEDNMNEERLYMVSKINI